MKQGNRNKQDQRNEFDLRLYRHLDGLSAHLREVNDVRKAVRHVLRSTREFLGVTAACAAVLGPDRQTLNVLYSVPSRFDWDEDLLLAFLQHTRPRIPSSMIVTPVRRRERSWAVLAFQDEGMQLRPQHREAIDRVARLLLELIARVEDDRIRSVQARIEQKITQQLAPKDIVYEILHGLRTLTRYDHSSSLYVCPPDGDDLELVAEQIAWTKGGSRRVGRRIPLDAPGRDLLEGDAVHVVQRRDGAWVCDSDPRWCHVVDLVGSADSGGGEPAKGAMLCAPLASPDGTRALMLVNGLSSVRLGEYEGALMARFRPLACLTLQYLSQTESFQTRMLEAERKYAMANVMRGIAHDVNNALGAVLPLVQHLRAQSADGVELDSDELTEDLSHIESSVQTCRRIFGSMLTMARSSQPGASGANLRRALDTCLGILGDGLRRRGVETRLEIPPEMPSTRGGQGDLIQLLLNLCSNARDAMEDGGVLFIGASMDTDALELTITDTGCGIPPSDMVRIEEPFFTTKPQGNGLGLSICRSIVWNLGGRMNVESREGEGTRVTLRLPTADAEIGGTS